MYAFSSLNCSFQGIFYISMENSIYVTGFAGLIRASDFATLMRHNFICGSAMKLKFTVSLV